MILLAALIYAIILLWALSKAPDWALGLIAGAILIIAFGWLGMVAVAFGVGCGIAIIMHHAPPRH